MICDFCSSPDVLWDYPCVDFDADLPDGREFHSSEGWLACKDCADAIEAGDPAQLLAHTMSRFSEHGDGYLDASYIQDLFFQHRSGPRVFYQ